MSKSYCIICSKSGQSLTSLTNITLNKKVLEYKFIDTFIDISTNTSGNLVESYAAVEEFVCHLCNYKTLSNVNLVRVAAFMKAYKVDSKEEVLKVDQNFEGSMLPPCKRELKQHLLRTTYIAQLWSNANLAIPNSSSPTDYGWIKKEEKFIFRWLLGEQLPTLTSVLNEKREISEIEEDMSELSETEINRIIENDSDIEYEEEIYFLEESMKWVLEKAFNHYKTHTCIQFVPRTTEKDYVRIFPGQGCYSHVGRTGGAQPLSLGLHCGWEATIIHELGHAIGFYHEQNRSDRDKYIRILWENIKEGTEDQFFLLKPHQNQLLTPFDYESIMLYGSYSFSKDRKAKLRTMEAIDGSFLKEPFAKGKLSSSDIQRIRKLYKC